jgi:hypothetical protein
MSHRNGNTRLYCGNCAEEGHLYTDPECPIRKTMKVTHDPTCTYCQQFKPGDMFPSHEASKRCQSGGRNHCTCDTCF